jgi:hypothetical protein
VGFSAGRVDGDIEAMRLSVQAWQVEPLRVDRASSSFFDDQGCSLQERQSSTAGWRYVRCLSHGTDFHMIDSTNLGISESEGDGSAAT